jgi:hypothetical protein
MNTADYVIELDNIGAIRSAKILIPKDGGVVVLTAECSADDGIVAVKQ